MPAYRAVRALQLGGHDFFPASRFGHDLDRRRRRDALQHLAEHGFLRPERLHAAVLQHQQLIDRLDADRPVRHHDHDGAALARAAHRTRQRLVALAVEIGVRLVEHDQERIAVERARQRHALGLAGRERRALLADLGVVALAHLDDHLMHAGFLGGGDDRFRLRFGIEAADVLRHGAGEQFDILRQIADVAAEHVRRPLVERRAVEPHLAAGRHPDADQRAHQRRLARTARADDADAGAGLDREIDVLHDDALVARRHDADGLDRQPLRRRLQQRLFIRRRYLLQQLGQAMPALARGDKTLPVRDGEIDRRQRAGAQDRARDDDAGGGFLVDHEVGADREHRRLQHHAQDFGDRPEAAGDVAGALIARQIGLVGLAPAPGQASGHAHRDQHLGVAPAGGGEIVAPRRQRHRLLCRRARQELGDQRQRHQNDGAHQSGDAEQPVKRKADREIERQPRQIEERARPHAAEKRPDIVEVAQRLQALVAAAYQ